MEQLVIRPVVYSREWGHSMGFKGEKGGLLAFCVYISHLPQFGY